MNNWLILNIPYFLKLTFQLKINLKHHTNELHRYELKAFYSSQIRKQFKLLI